MTALPKGKPRVAKRKRNAKALATTLHSKIVRSRGYCESCGISQNLQCAHIVSRRFSATRTREDNAFCLCAKCHMFFTEWPLEFAKFVIGAIGEEKYQALRWDAHHLDPPGWENEIQRLTKSWKEIEAAA